MPIPSHRNKLLALLTILSVSAYLLLAYPRLRLVSSVISQQHHPSNSNQVLALPWNFRNRDPTPKPKPLPARKRPHPHLLAVPPQLILDPVQELAAIANFLISLPQNAIPSSVDPDKTIDPQLVLDFDTRAPSAQTELKAIMQEVWTRNPVVLFCKLHSPISRELKAKLALMQLYPPPTIFDVDQRTDAQILVPLLLRLTSTPTLPILLVGGHPLGSIAAIRALIENGELRKMIKDAGAQLGYVKKKGGR